MSATDDQEEFVLSLIGCQKRLRGFLRCLLVAPDDLDDLIQETNRVLVKKASSFKPGTDFWAWACQVARFEALAHFRRHKKERHVFNTQLIEDLAVRAESVLGVPTDIESALTECLKQVSPTSARLLEGRYVEGLKVQSLANKLGRPSSSIRQSLYRIRQQLRSCVELRVEESQNE